MAHHVHRADLALKEIFDHCVGALESVREASSRPLFSKLKRGAVEISEPPEFEIIWDNLDVFPRALIVRLARIRRSIRIANRMISEGDFETGVMLDADYGPHLGRILDECKAAVADLKPQISNLIHET